MVIFLQMKAPREKLFDIHEARCIKDYSCEFTGGFNYVKILCYVPTLPAPLVNHWSIGIAYGKKDFLCVVYILKPSCSNLQVKEITYISDIIKTYLK